MRKFVWSLLACIAGGRAQSELARREHQIRCSSDLLDYLRSRRELSGLGEAYVIFVDDEGGVMDDAVYRRPTSVHNDLGQRIANCGFDVQAQALFVIVDQLPGGELPSTADHALAHDIFMASNRLGITMIDYLVVSHRALYSLGNARWLREARRPDGPEQRPVPPARTGARQLGGNDLLFSSGKNGIVYLRTP